MLKQQLDYYKGSLGENVSESTVKRIGDVGTSTANGGAIVSQSTPTPVNVVPQQLSPGLNNNNGFIGSPESVSGKPRYLAQPTVSQMIRLKEKEEEKKRLKRAEAEKIKDNQWRGIR